MHTSTYIAVSSLFVLGFVPAQTTSTCVLIGTPGSVGCQFQNSPAITGGVVATGDVGFHYNQGTAILRVIVTNTSPIVGGETNPLITEIGWNWPAGVTGATLQTQVGSGGTPPTFAFHFASPPTIMMACLGDFGANLCIAGITPGIGNAAATVFPHPNVAIGPVIFTLQLSGPGVGGITAHDIAAAQSTNGIEIALKFQGGGVNGAESGWVGNGGPCCPTQASSQTFGTGCAPQGVTIPTLSSLNAPILGGPIGIGVASPSTPNVGGVMLLGFNNTFSFVFGAPLPLDLGPFGFPGCTLYSSGHFLTTIMTDGSGDASYSTGMIPGTNLKWCGQEFTFQAFLLTGNLDVISTGGLTATAGS